MTVVKSTVAATTLSVFGTGALPYLYLASAGLVTVGSITLGHRAKVWRPALLLQRAVRAVAALLLAWLLLQPISEEASAALMFVTAEGYATLLSVMFWGALSDAMTVRQQRRSFTHFSAASMLGVLLGGLSVRLVPNFVSPTSAIAIVAVTLLCMPGLLNTLPREHLRPSEQVSQPVVSLFRLPLARAILLFVLLCALGSATIDFSFRRHAHSAYSQEQWAVVFGDLNSIVAVLGLVVQLMLGQRLLSSIGLFGVLSLVPLGVLVTSGLTLLSPANSSVWFAQKIFDMVASYALLPAAGQLLYNGLPAAERTALRALIDGTGKRLGTALAGLILLLLTRYAVATSSGLATQTLGNAVGYLPLVLGGAALMSLPVLRRRYLSSLAASLRDPNGERSRPRALTLSFAQHATIDPDDASTRSALVAALSASSGSQVLGALSLLCRVQNFDFAPHVGHLLIHPDWRVRVAGVDLCGRHQLSEQTAFVTRLLRDRDPSVRRRAAMALPAIAGPSSVLTLEPLLADSEDPVLRTAAITALWTSRLRRDLADQALRDLLARYVEHSEALRIELARAIGQLGSGPYSVWLTKLLDDRSPAVRRAAATACGETRDPTLIPALLERLSDAETALSVREALLAFSDAALPRVWALLDDREAPLALRMKLPRLLQGFASDGAVEVALFSNPKDEPALQYRLVLALLQLRTQHQNLSFDRSRADQAAVRRLQEFSALQPMRLALQEGGAGYRALLRAVQHRQMECAVSVCVLLSLCRPTRLFMAVIEGLRDGTQLPNSLELLDEALRMDSARDASLRQQVLLTLEPGASRRSVYESPEEAARMLLRSNDAIMKAIARHTLEQQALHQGVPLVSTIFQWLQNKPAQDSGAVPSSLTAIERTLVLEGLAAFNDVSIDDLAAVADIAGTKVFNANELIFSQGDPGAEMFVIVKGSVTMSREHKELFSLPANELFGQVSFLDQGVRPVSAHAGRSGAMLLVIPRQPFMDVVVDRPDLLNAVFSVLTKRIRALIERNGELQQTV